MNFIKKITKNHIYILIAVLSLAIILGTCNYRNKLNTVKIIKESFDPQFNHKDIGRILKYDNNTPYECNLYLDIIVKLSQNYDCDKLLDSPNYIGYGKVKDFYEVGLMLSMVISNIGSSKEGHVLTKLGNDPSFLDNNPRNLMDDFTIGVLFIESKELHFFKYKR